MKLNGIIELDTAEPFIDAALEVKFLTDTQNQISSKIDDLQIAFQKSANANEKRQKQMVILKKYHAQNSVQIERIQAIIEIKK